MRFEEECELIGYLGKEMTARYREPEELPIDFDHKLSVFLALKDIEPTPTWCAWYFNQGENRFHLTVSYDAVEKDKALFIFKENSFTSNS